MVCSAFSSTGPTPLIIFRLSAPPARAFAKTAGLAAAFAAGLAAAFAAGLAAAGLAAAFVAAGFAATGEAAVAIASLRAAAVEVVAAPVVASLAFPEFVSCHPIHKIIATITATIRPIKMAPGTLYANAKSATAAANRPKRAEIAMIPFRFGAISVIVFILPEGARYCPRFTRLFHNFSTMVTAIAQSSDVTISRIAIIIEAFCDPNTLFCGSLCRNCPI